MNFICIKKISARAFSLMLLVLFSFVFIPEAWAGAPKGEKVTPKLSSSKKYAVDRVIVKFKDKHKADLKNLREGITTSGTGLLERNLGQAKVRILKENRSVGLTTLEVTDKKKSVEEIIKDLEQSGMVEYAEPDYMLQVEFTPNDLLFDDLWGLHNTAQDGGSSDADIDAQEAWDIQTGDGTVIVGVIDSGVDYDHIDLADNIWVNTGETVNGIDDDGNGYIDDIHGIDTASNDSDPMDYNNHGTHVTGTIGAVGNNSLGVAGINHNVQIMPCKFTDSTGNGLTSDAIECLDYFKYMKDTLGWNIKLTSNSYGGGGFSTAHRNAIQAAGNSGMLFVASAGNGVIDTDSSPHYPNGYTLDNIIAVTATNRNDLLSFFSNFGVTSVDLGAPGSDIVSTTIGNTYTSYYGTSMATPHVAGAAALIWAQYPSLTHTEVKNLILNSVDPLSSLTGKTVSGGRLNVNNALTCSSGNLNMLVGSPGDGFTAVLGQSKNVSVSLSDCATSIAGGTVSVTPSNGESAFNLLDDGVAPDANANDGVYTANWVPTQKGAVTFDFTGSSAGSPSGDVFDSVSGQVIPNYLVDEAIAFNWIDATTGTDLGMTEIDDYKWLAIPFEFVFYGDVYNAVRVSSNGYLTFGIDGIDWSNDPIPSSNEPNNFIAPFWDDLNPSAGGAVYYLLEGTAPNRKLTIEWSGLPHYNNIGDATFEVTLYEGSNDIVFQYQDVDFPGTSYDNGASATIGLEYLDGAAGLEYSYNTPSSPGVTNGTAVRFYLPEGEVPMIALGLDSGGNGYMQIIEGLPPYGHLNWARVQWTAYNTANGETRPVFCDVDGDNKDELVVGLGAGSGGWLEVKDDADTGFAHLDWLLIPWSSYNTANGETFPSCSDPDHDGKDELVIGLGNGGDGWLVVWDDATTGYANMPDSENGWTRLQWGSYNSSSGKTFPTISKISH